MLLVPSRSGLAPARPRSSTDGLDEWGSALDFFFRGMFVI